MFDLALAAAAILCLSAVLAAIVARSDRLCLRVGTAGALLASALGAVGAAGALLAGEERSLHLQWPLPVGELHLGTDPLSSFFLLCIFTVSGLAAIYGAGYLPSHLGTRRLAPAVAFFNLLVAAMVLVVVARDGILLIVAWEIMSIASFFLVAFEHDRADVRRAAFTYLIASQLGVVFLFILFALLGRNAAFLLALVGFGTKAGFWPLHVWLPDAHPAAPSHVSALMSGVMIKMGIYGLLRTLLFLGPPPAWWGVVLVAIGAVSGILGVLQALAQHDLKRLLAYHSVENIGIIALGIGVGLLGQSHAQPAVAFLGFAGALLHVLNHGLFKTLLFQGAGSVLHATRTADLDSLGGLQRRMPTTGLTFLRAAAAQRLRERVARLRRGAPRRRQPAARLGFALPGRRAGAGADRRPGGRLFREGVRRGLSRRAAHPVARAGARAGASDAGGDDPVVPAVRRHRPVARGSRAVGGARGGALGHPGFGRERHRGRAVGNHLRGRRDPRLGRGADAGARPPLAVARRHAGGDLGLRLRGTHPSHAVHRCLVRQHGARAVRAGDLFEDSRRAAARPFSHRGSLRGACRGHGG